MAKNYFNRYVWLIDTIQRYGHITLSEISRKWQKSSLNEDGSPLAERTFHNHREAILDTFGLEIKCDRSLGYYIANSDDLEGDSVKQWLLESLSMANLLNESSDMRDCILFEKIPSSKQWLPVIVNAMRDGRALKMTYHSFWSDTSVEYDTHPSCLKLFKQRWYMLSKSEGKPQPRIYARDRIENLDILNKPLIRPADFHADEFFSNYFGIIVGDNVDVTTVDIKVDADQVKYLESLPLHKSQTVIEEAPDYTVYRYRIVPTFDFKQEILSRGATFEILSPEWLRNEVRDDIAAMAKRYGL